MSSYKEMATGGGDSVSQLWLPELVSCPEPARLPSVAGATGLRSAKVGEGRNRLRLVWAELCGFRLLSRPGLRRKGKAGRLLSIS